MATVEVVGYVGRIVSNKQAPNPTIGPYIVNTLLILVAPALFAATIYMVLGRIIVSVDGESLSLIKKRWLTKVFVTSDVVTFIVQLGGMSKYFYTSSRMLNRSFNSIQVPHYCLAVRKQQHSLALISSWQV